MIKCLFGSQNVRYSGLISFGTTGFLVVTREALEVLEWDGDSKTLEKTALTVKESLILYQALGISAKYLNCG